MKKVLLVDGNNILFRSYYATAYNGNTMKNSKGFPTNALYGLINMMNKIIKEEHPEYIMVALDKGKTFRHEKYLEYKAGRIVMPDELKMQFPVAKEILNAMGITYYETDGYEADDIIGTFAKKCDEPGDEYEGLIISSDKDLLQLISDEVTVKLLKSSGDAIYMDRNLFKETYGVEPINMIDIKALMGDASDNIPGVKGIGEKTAINLLSKYQTIENLYDHIDEVTGKTKDKLIEDKDKAFMSKDIATIYREVPIDLDFNKITYKGIDVDKYTSLLKELEFYSLIKKLDIQPSETTEGVKLDKEINNIKIVKDINEVKLDKPYSIYLEVLGTNYHKGKPLGFGIYNEDNSLFIPWDIYLNNKDIFMDDIPKYTYDLKKLLVVLKYHNSLIKSCNYDAMIAGYLLNMNVKNDISVIANNYGYDITFYDEFFGTSARPKEYSEDSLAKLCINKAKFIYDTKDILLNDIEKEDMKYLFNEIEMPLTYVLADMESSGIRCDANYLEEFGKEINSNMEDIEHDIYSLAGEEFNILSPKQLGVVLFEHMGISYPKRLKTGESYSTSKEILDKLSDEPIVEKVLEYRTLSKLYSNYVVGLIEEIGKDGKIHTTFNQTLTRTGRLSSEEPNLQNIPMRMEFGKLIRKGFLPEEESKLLSSDYSQIELRIFAHICKEKNLIDAFNHDLDIHAKTASDIFHKDIKDVTKEERRQAKAVNFGIIYGISSFGLSEDLGIDFKDAKQFIDNYLETFPGIKKFMDDTISEAHRNGYSKTLMGRKRVIDELNNKNYLIRSQGERMALNTPIQGTGADILKKAMVELYNELNKRGLKSKMLIQVHDEVVLNVLDEELDEVKELVKNIMENTYKLDVPLKVDIEVGTNWYDAK